MLRTFEIRGKKFINFDLDDEETISMLKNEYGITDEEIARMKDSHKLPSMEERLEALEMAMLEIIMGGEING